MALIGMILTLSLELLFIIFLQNFNIFSYDPLAQSENYISACYLILKITLVIYTTVDYNGNLSKVLCTILCCAYLFILFYRYFNPSFYVKSILYVMAITEAALAWITICVEVNILY